MKRFAYLSALLLTLVLLVGCNKPIHMSGPNNVTISLGASENLHYSTSDEKGLTFQSSDDTIVSVDENGILKGLKVGSATIIVRSKSRPKMVGYVNVSVVLGDIIDIEGSLVVEKDRKKLLDVYTNIAEGVFYESLDEDILTVDEEGLVSGVSVGTAKVKIVSKKDNDFFKEIDVTVVELLINDELAIVEVDGYLTLDIDASDDYALQSANTNIVVVEDKNIKGVKVGTTTITVYLKDFPEVRKRIDVEVIDAKELVLEKWIDEGENYDLGAENIIPNAVYETSDETIVTVTEEGIIQGVKPGIAEVTMTSQDGEKSYTFTIYVKTDPRSINLDAPSKMLVGASAQLQISFVPAYSDPNVLIQPANPEILSVDEDGTITAVRPGSTGLRVSSVSNPSIARTIYITVYSILLVDQTKESGDVVQYNGFDFEFGSTLFGNISDAVDRALNGTEIIVYSGTYDEYVYLNKEVNFRSQGNVTLKQDVVINAPGTTVNGFTFVNKSKIYGSDARSNITIINNKVNDLELDSPFIKLENVNGFNISNNEIISSSNVAIEIINFSIGDNIIKGNIIKNAHTAISIKSSGNYLKDTKLEVVWNDIDNVEEAFNVDLGSGTNVEEIRQIIRFNKVSNYNKAAILNEGHSVDLNLNYWGELGPKLDSFVNVSLEELDGFYLSKEEVIKEEDYDHRYPVKVVITNKIDEIEVGEEYTIEFKVFPKELSDDTVRPVFSHLPAIERDEDNLFKIKTLYSYDVVITLRSNHNASINDSFTLQITTDPYLELLPDNLQAGLVVGGTLKLETVVVPYQIRNEEFIYESTNEAIATVDNFGNVELLAPGTVTIKTHLKMDPEVKSEFTFVVFESLDLSNAFDFALSTMVTYSRYRTWNVFGVSHDYQAEYMDSVSRLLIEDIEVNQSMMLPNIDDLRPGRARPKPNLPEDQIYNDAHVQYVVVHETANTNPDGGAYWHARYLYNQNMGETDRLASWHFTLDDKEIYQHIPTDEIAWHAGDGSTLAGSPWTGTNAGGIGGGNMNGIGMETSVAEGDDIMKTWHRIARFAATLSKYYNLPKHQPRENVKFHNDFSGKSCPQSMIKGNQVEFFYSLVETEYIKEYDFPSLELEINSHNLEYLANDGRIMKLPEKAMTVSYDVTITYEGESITKTLYVYLPGQLR